MTRSLMTRCLVAGVLAASASTQTLPPIKYVDLAFPAYTLTSDLVFGSNQNPWFPRVDTLKLDIYEPQGDTSLLRPAMVYIHGGQWTYGDKTDAPVVTMMLNMAVRGVVGFAINYRLADTTSAGVQGANVLAEDAKAAIRWIRKNAQQWRIDPNRIGVAGESVGANGAIVTGYTSWEGTSGNPGYPSNVQWVLDLWGRGVTPINDPNVTLCIVHGDADPANSYAGEALRMQAEAAANGVTCELITLPGAGHTPWDRWSTFSPRFIERQWEALKLMELGGVNVVPGWSSPGVFAPTACGWGGDLFALFLSTNRVEIPIPYLGTLCLDPSLLIQLWATSFPASPRVSQSFTAFQIPGGYSGMVHIQGMYVRTGIIPRLSNCFSAQF